MSACRTLWKKQTPEQKRQVARSKRLKALFNISAEEYDKVLQYQGGVCAISGRPMRRPAVDHDHKSGLVRGIIDWNVNRSLAGFMDNPEWLRAAAEYLEHPPVTAALGEEVYGVLGKVTRKPKNRRYGPLGTKTPFPRGGQQ